MTASILGATDVALYGPEITAIYQQADVLVISTGNTFENRKERHPNASGEIREVHVVKTPFRSPTGDIEQVMGVYWDVTETNRELRQVQSWREGFVRTG